MVWWTLITFALAESTSMENLCSGALHNESTLL
jgi:hypothetical protein